jgi:hypothetical protein
VAHFGKKSGVSWDNVSSATDEYRGVCSIVAITIDVTIFDAGGIAT